MKKSPFFVSEVMQVGKSTTVSQKRSNSQEVLFIFKSDPQIFSISFTVANTQHDSVTWLEHSSIKSDDVRYLHLKQLSILGRQIKVWKILLWSFRCSLLITAYMAPWSGTDYLSQLAWGSWCPPSTWCFYSIVYLFQII